MHVSRSEGPGHGGTPLSPGLSVGGLAKLPGISRFDTQRLFATLDIALFQNLSQTDVSKLLELFDRASSGLASNPPPAAGEHASAEHPLPDEPREATQQRNVTEQLVEPMFPEFAAKVSAAEVHVARLQAETRLMAAGEAVSGAHHLRLPDWDAAPEKLLQVSQDLFSQGGYLNYLRSAEVSQLLLFVGTTASIAVEQRKPPRAIMTAGGWRNGAWRQQWNKRTSIAFLLVLLGAVALYVLLR